MPQREGCDQRRLGDETREANVSSEVDLMFRAFSDRTRLQILCLLHKGEFCVGDICLTFSRS